MLITIAILSSSAQGLSAKPSLRRFVVTLFIHYFGLFGAKPTPTCLGLKGFVVVVVVVQSCTSA